MPHIPLIGGQSKGLRILIVVVLLMVMVIVTFVVSSRLQDSAAAGAIKVQDFI